MEKKMVRVYYGEEVEKKKVKHRDSKLKENVIRSTDCDVVGACVLVFVV